MPTTESVRIDKRLLDKVRVIADREDRALKAQLERLIEAALATNGKRAKA